MRFSLLAVSVVALAGACCAPPARGDLSVPSAANSSVPNCLLTSPNGTIATAITVRDYNNLPIANSAVTLVYSGCTGFMPCAQQASDAYHLDLVNKWIIGVTGASPWGQVVFNVRAGGGCSANDILVYADGFLLKSIRAASADQNGDLVVDGADVALAHGKIGTADLTGDLDCDGDVDAADEAAVASRIGETCLSPTAARARTWGNVKLIYR